MNPDTPGVCPGVLEFSTRGGTTALQDARASTTAVMASSIVKMTVDRTTLRERLERWRVFIVI